MEWVFLENIYEATAGAGCSSFRNQALPYCLSQANATVALNAKKATYRSFAA